jgi:hypothetical protein
MKRFEENRIIKRTDSKLYTMYKKGQAIVHKTDVKSRRCTPEG